METREQRRSGGPTGPTRLRNFLLVSAIVALTISQQHAQAKETSSKQTSASIRPAAITNAAAQEAREAKAARQDSQALDRKQGDQIDSLFNTDEYVQIKPEEIGAGEPGKELDSATLSLADLPSAQSESSAGAKPSGSSASTPAEHKSADDELNAQLAQDSISTMESASRSYATAEAPPAPKAADPRAARPQYAPARGGYMPARGPHVYPRGPSRDHRPPPPHGYGPRPPTDPASGYLSLKGKLAGGISSMVPYAPRPYAPGPVHRGHPPAAYGNNNGNGSPRYLPRGAAAGYAAFREFVRAQANRYKQPGGLGSGEPLAYNAAPPIGPIYGAPPQMSHAPPTASQGPGPQQASYGKPEASDYPASEQPVGYGIAPAAAKPAPKAKVTVAQAYIPHLAPAQGAAGAGYAGKTTGEQPYPANPMLAKLYGGHAPEGVGRPVYSRDYGMVIHYPQATVYTEPMTVDQLHKLAGSSITQVLEHLQYNIANGQRDESNTIRPNKKHHLGHGLTIQAKEYLAPSKSGHYVPTTAAVISSSKGHAGHDEPAAQATGYGNAPASVSSSYPPQAAPAPTAAHPPVPELHTETGGYGGKPVLGSGYERVKAAAAASSTRYNQPPKPVGFYGHSAGAPASQPAAPGSQSGAGYPQAPPAPQPAGKYEPLGHIATIIGSELESLYNKANSVLSKQIDPEIHAHVQAHLRSLTKQIGPVKMSEHDHKSPLVLSPLPSGGEHRAPRPYGPAAASGNSGYPRPPTSSRSRAPRKPHHYPAQHHPGNRHPGQHRPRPQQSYGHQQQQQSYGQQQQAYNSAEQQQLAQIIHEFQLGDNQYTPKNHPVQASNQGYPSKLMQQQQQQQEHYHKQQQQQQYQAPAGPLPYEHSEGLELPHGPNDQIGEISELMEALKGTLEAHKSETGPAASSAGYGQQAPAKDHGKIEDVRYLASALGQVPSYAIQVPVSHPQQSAESAVYEAAKKAEQQHGHSQQQQQQSYGQQQQQSYGQQQQSYGQQQQSYGQQQQHQQQQGRQQYGQQSGYQQAAQNGGYQEPAAPQLQAHQQSAPQTPNYGPRQTDQTAYQTHESAAYGQQQQQPQQFQQSAGYGQQATQAAAAQSYSVTSHQLGINHIAPVQQTAGYATAPATIAAAAPVVQQQVGTYGQQQASGGDYQQPAAEQQPAPAIYATPAAPVAVPLVGHEQPQQQTYQQQQQQQQLEQQPIVQQPYSSLVETSQVINHIVPVQQHAQQAAPTSDSYQQSSSAATGQHLAAVTSDVTHEPVNQIGAAEPSDSQYQSAQSLSSFVDSLPSDYQELLRQPASHSALLESAASTQHESASVAEPTGSSKTSASAQSSSSSTSSSSSHRRQTADQQAVASSISSSYQQQPLSAKSAAFHSSSSSSSSSSSASSSPSSKSSLTSEQASDSQATSSASKSSAAAASRS